MKIFNRFRYSRSYGEERSVKTPGQYRRPPLHRSCFDREGAALEKPVLDTIDTANIDILADIPDEEQQILKKNLRLLAGLEEN